MKSGLLIASLALLVPGLAAGAGSGGAYSLPRTAIARGGGRGNGGAYVLYGTIGQRAPGRAAGGPYVLSGGFALNSTGEPPPPIDCGNGDVNLGEQCDRGAENGTPGSCCSRNCRYEAPDKTCRPAAGPCDLDERCTGESALCTADAKSSAICRVGPTNCFKDAFCDGRGTDCPANPFNNGDLCNDDDICTVTDSCHDGVCTPGQKACEVEVANEFQLRVGRKKVRAPKLMVRCFSASDGDCDAQIFLADDTAAVRSESSDAAPTVAEDVLITQPRRRPKRVHAGKTVTIRLRLNKNGIRLLKQKADTVARGTAAVTVRNASGPFPVKKPIVLKLVRILRGR